MLITLLAWIYLTLLCYTWGLLLLSLTNKFTKEKMDQPEFSFVCLLGLICITTIASLLSLFLPTGSLIVQLIVLIPAIIYFITGKMVLRIKNEIDLFASLKTLPKLLFFCCLVLILILSSTYILYLDSIGYHAQTIQWIKKYKAIPGLVHLHRRYGYQGLWYVTGAFFYFSFLKINLVTFINTSVLVWFFLFIAKKLNSCFLQPGINYTFLFWAGLLGISLLSFNQIRLAATTPSPDFIAVLYTWSVFYFFINKKLVENEPDKTRLFLIILFSSFALTIKLSVFPVFLFALAAFIMLIKITKIKLAVITVAVPLLLFFCMITRNIITSGYIVFPSTTIDAANVDWKYDKELTQLEKNYITAYARTRVDYTKDKVEAVMNMKITEWLPVWWKQMAIADKFIVGLIAIAVIIFLFRLKEIFTNRWVIIFPVLVAVAGLAFWFTQAPDPRFGFGFIIPFIGLAFIPLQKINIANKMPTRKIYNLVIAMFCLSIIIYAVYWITKNDSKNIALLPKGLKSIPYKTVKINEISFNIPENETACSGTPVPCVYDSSQTFILRGKNVTDGFKEKQGKKSTSWRP